jgi:hypothetical protein
MELFKKFNETIFYKCDNELKLQIDALKKLQEKYPDNENLKYKLKICELGLYGENEIEFELKNANIGMYVLKDVNLKYNDLTAQIDYLLITPAYIYFIECKNLIGNITVNERGEFIREYNYNGKKIKEGIYSPIRQAERHIEIFKKLWIQRRTSLLDKVFQEQRLSWFKPLVVITNSKSILNIKFAPKDIKNNIIKSDSLINYIKKDIEKTDKDLLSNKKSMHTDAFTIMQNYNQEINKDYEKEFKKSLIDNKKEINNNLIDIKKQLLEFRNITAQNKKIPAYYVFNNDELEKLLKYKPKTLSELKKLNILSDIKIKIHGQNIINIINKI